MREMHGPGRWETLLSPPALGDSQYTFSIKVLRIPALSTVVFNQHFPNVFDHQASPHHHSLLLLLFRLLLVFVSM